jgi:DNA-binding NarL/FixJ family response regulator
MKPKAISPSRRTAVKSGDNASQANLSGRKKILLVDDHPMMRAGLAQLINMQVDMVVACEVGSPAEALNAIPKYQPDLLATDMTMPGRSGIEFVKDIAAIHADLPILVVSMHDELIYAERVLRAGARGYIMKEAGGENLLAAIRHVLSGQTYVSERMSAKMVESMTSRTPRGSSSPIAKLSDREFEVFQLIGQGQSTREIAKHLHLSPKTVDVHRSHIKEKLDLRDVTALVRHAVRWVETQGSQPKSD